MVLFSSSFSLSYSAQWRQVHGLGRPREDGLLSTHPREERSSTAPNSWRRRRHTVLVGLICTPMAASASSCTYLHNLSHQAHRDVLLYKEPIFLVDGVVEVTGCMPKKPNTASLSCLARWRQVHGLGRPRDDGLLSTHLREERSSTAPNSWRRSRHTVLVGLICTPMAASASSCAYRHNLSHQAYRDVLLYKEPIILVDGVVEVTGCMPKKPNTASIHGCQCGCDALRTGMRFILDGDADATYRMLIDMDEAHMFVASVSGLALEGESKANFSMFQGLRVICRILDFLPGDSTWTSDVIAATT